MDNPLNSNHMRRFILGLCLCLGMSLAANAQEYALIDMEYILEHIPAYKSATDSMKQANDRWEAEIKKVSDEAKNMYDAYQKNASQLPESDRTAKENAIVDKEKEAAELRRKYFGPEGEMAKMRDRLVRPIQDDIYNAVKEVALDYNYAMVIDRASASSIIFAMPDIDISDEVLSRLEQR